MATVVVAGWLAIASPARAEAVTTWRPFVAEASQRFGLPVSWIERVIGAESGGRTRWRGRPTISRAGAMGLMQLMPGTWAAMRATLGLGTDPHDPRDNILAGTAYLRMMYDSFGYPGLFAAYNAGPGRYAAHLSGRGALASGATHREIAEALFAGIARKGDWRSDGDSARLRVQRLTRTARRRMRDGAHLEFLPGPESQKRSKKTASLKS